MRTLIVEADGGSRGNPGVAGYGALVRDPATGQVLAQRAAPLGQASNNVAEYSGMIAGLQAVIDRPADLSEPVDVLVRMDSKLVVEQMLGRWKIKHADMRRLALLGREAVRAIEQSGGRVDFEWIPRAQNGPADALSNVGMDGEQVSLDAWDGVAPTVENPAPGGPQPGPTFGDARVVVPAARKALQSLPTFVDPVRLILVRHGVTDFTVTGRLDGRAGADPALNERGLAQARASASAVAQTVARYPDVPVTVLTSTLLRARQTGGVIAERLGVVASIDADWDEQSFGDWDGEALADLAESAAEDLTRLRADIDYSRPGGESHRDLTERVAGAWIRAIDVGGIVVVASHRKPLMCALSEVLGIDHQRIWSLATDPCSLSMIEVWPDGAASVAYVNDTHHLRSVSAL